MDAAALAAAALAAAALTALLFAGAPRADAEWGL